MLTQKTPWQEIQKKISRANKESRILLLPDISAPEAKRKKISQKQKTKNSATAPSSSSPTFQRLTKINLLLQARVSPRRHTRRGIP
jgi:hypothetical protein